MWLRYLITVLEFFFVLYIISSVRVFASLPIFLISVLASPSQLVLLRPICFYSFLRLLLQSASLPLRHLPIFSYFNFHVLFYVLISFFSSNTFSVFLISYPHVQDILFAFHRSLPIGSVISQASVFIPSFQRCLLDYQAETSIRCLRILGACLSDSAELHSTMY